MSDISEVGELHSKEAFRKASAKLRHRVIEEHEASCEVPEDKQRVLFRSYGFGAVAGVKCGECGLVYNRPLTEDESRFGNGGREIIRLYRVYITF